MTTQAQLHSTVSTLTQLRSLKLTLLVDPDTCTPDTVRPHATCVARLGALTSLTHLGLNVHPGHMFDGDSWREQQEAGVDHVAWAEVTEVQRTLLLSALRAMPQLQHLSCFRLWLRPSEVAPLTALTSLTVGGLLPPQAAPTAANAGAASCASGGSLPPHLQTLALWEAVPPSALAALQPPPSLKELKVPGIRFGMSDVSPDCRVLPEAMQESGLAAQRLAPYLRLEWWRELEVAGDCGPRPMGPPEAGPRGHTGWIVELAMLSSRSQVKFDRVRLRVGDLACLVATLPKLQASTAVHSCRAPGAVQLWAVYRPCEILARPETYHTACGLSREQLWAAGQRV